ncbi:MAG: allophanate hydrolase subunit 1 [Nocardioidaceae bacterium]
MSPPAMLAYGDRALLLELGDAGRVLAWTDALGRARLPGVGDLVPAAATLLVVIAEGADVAAVRSALEGFEEPDPSAQRPEDGDVLEVPVSYDGPDLAEVARLTGLTEAEIVEAHTSTTWRVAFGGFAPGFGYLVGGDARLVVPRRESARTSVPAGAVGLAGEFSGVYPRESPGGWQLIGTTSLPMWDPERDPPAVLLPGARVRFVVAGS